MRDVWLRVLSATSSTPKLIREVIRRCCTDLFSFFDKLRPQCPSEGGMIKNLNICPDLYYQSSTPGEADHMAHIDFAQKAVITDGDKILLVRKSSEDPHNPGRWEFPGGRMKDSEDVDMHIVREVLEETGLTIKPGEVIHLWDWTMAWHGEEVRVVAVSRYCELTSSPVAVQQLEEDDFISEQQWFRRSELTELDVIPSQLATVNLVVNDKADH